MKKGLLFTIIVLLCSLSGQFATELYLPSMPSMAKYFKVHISQIQLTITSYVLGVSIGSFIFGYASDKLGRLRIVFPCLLLSVASCIMCCVASSINFLLFSRFIQGIGLGGVTVIARSIIRDVSSSRTEFAKFASLLGTASAVVIALAPVLGGYVEQYLFWRINFIFLFIFTFILAWLCRFKLEETNLKIGKLEFVSMFEEYWNIIKNQQFLLYNILSSLTLAGVMAYQTVSSFLLQTVIGLGPAEFGYTSVVITAAIIIGSVLNTKVVERRGLDNMLQFGIVLFIIAGVIYVLCGYFNYIGVLQIIIPMMIFSFASGIIYPNASSGALCLITEHAGTAASIYNCFQMIGATFGSWLVSIITNKNQLPLGFMFLFIGLVGLVIHYKILLKFSQIG